MTNIHSHCAIHHAFSYHLHKFLGYSHLIFLYVCRCWYFWTFHIYFGTACVWLRVCASNCFGISSRNSCAFLIPARVSRRRTQENVRKTDPCEFESSLFVRWHVRVLFVFLVLISALELERKNWCSLFLLQWLLIHISLMRLFGWQTVRFNQSLMWAWSN